MKNGRESRKKMDERIRELVKQATLEVGGTFYYTDIIKKYWDVRFKTSLWTKCLATFD